MGWSKRLLTFAATAVMLLAAGGCRPRYMLNGSALDYNIYRTISIENFPIRAALVYPPLQTTFENTMVDYIERNTRLQTSVGNSNADLQLEGEITQYALSPVAVGTDAYATQTRLTIGVRIRYIDNKAEGANKDIDRTFTAYRDFDANLMLTDVQDDLCSQISTELVELIFNATLGNW